MSEGTRIPLSEAQHLAGYILDLLRPYCDRIEVVGSVRRLKPDVGDIELVCVPKVHWNLLGEAYWPDSAIEDTIHQAGFRFDRFNGEHFKQFDLGPCKCDLFITTPPCFGVIFTIRTGSADFSHRLVTQRNKGGLLPSYMHVKDGLLWAGDKVIPTPEERDVFKAIVLPWIEPSER